jgi:hypothetical protein
MRGVGRIFIMSVKTFLVAYFVTGFSSQFKRHLKMEEEAEPGGVTPTFFSARLDQER